MPARAARRDGRLQRLTTRGFDDDGDQERCGADATVPALGAPSPDGAPGASPGAAAAPPEAQPDTTTGDIVITANRRAENLQKVGISVVAASGATLQALNIARPEELTRLFPGFTSIPNAGSAATSYNIRGVGQSDFAEHEEQPVAAYQDGVYSANAAATGVPICELPRVDLLRGPQGTLFGRNSFGGTVNVITNQPKLQGFDVGGAVEVTIYEGRRQEGFVTLPLSDVLAVRVSGYDSQRDGWVKNSSGNDLHDDDNQVFRVQLLLQPSDSFSNLLRV